MQEASWALLARIKITASSAYISILTFWHTLGTSFIYKEKRIGQSKDPCGTLTGHSRYGDLIQSTETHCFLLDRYDSFRRMECSEKLNKVNLERRTW